MRLGWKLAGFVLFLGLGHGQRIGMQPPCDCSQPDAAAWNKLALDSHLKRRLDEASEAYASVLAADPAREPSETDSRRVLMFAPRVFVTRSEPFGLRDVAAVVHPRAPWIAYHFLWDDDIDFPDDNDPCDHEVMWVRLDTDRGRVRDYFTYFHGRILQAPKEAVDDANAHQGRPRVEVQWGKHGSMPPGWRGLSIVADEGDAERDHYPLNKPISLEAYNRGTFEKLSTVGRRAVGSPLGRAWPQKFSGSWRDFVDFSRPLDPSPPLRRKGFVLVSCWNNAVLDRHILTYNFRPKIEWPPRICEDLQND